MQKSAIYLPKEAQYEYLLNLPDSVDAGTAVNHAMELIEEQSEQLKGILPKTYTEIQNDLLRDILRIFNNSALDNLKDDVIGRIYEYFLNKFAKDIASDDGVFFTPKSLVKMIVNVIEPKRGVVLDPACGSGGMFVASSDFISKDGIHANQSMTFYGQEKVEYNAKLCLMNMAVHGLNATIKSGNEANTFYHDAHNLEGSCDYVMANPPFNVDKVKEEGASNAGRLPFGLPGVNAKKEFSNANYLWISYFYAYLNEKGRAGFVMASSATDSSGKDKNIREELVKTGHVDVIISVGNNFFYTKSLPCTLWFFDKGKSTSIQDKVLMLDARNYYTVVDRTLNEWTEWQLKNLSAIVALYRGETKKYQAILKEYSDELITQTKDISEIHEKMKTGNFSQKAEQIHSFLEKLKETSKSDIESAAKKEKKQLTLKWEEKLKKFETVVKIAKEAVWLYDKFGDGEYKDVLGLCKIVSRKEIKEHNYSLTPGGYVGVEEAEDDGVDFNTRMKEIHEELEKLQAESSELMKTISDNCLHTHSP